MPITMQQVLRQLDPEEPDYPALSALGPEAVPHLAALVQGQDPGVAAKAAYLASLIESDDSMAVVSAAAASPHDSVRVAAAFGLRNLAPAQALTAAERLLDDRDVGVRKEALRAVSELGLATLAPKVKTLSKLDTEPRLRALAKNVLRQLSEVRAELSKEATAPAERPTKRGGHRRRMQKTK